MVIITGNYGFKVDAKVKQKYMKQTGSNPYLLYEL
jgi:hypothetical protein